MMVTVLLYACCTGVRLSRRTWAACRTDAAFRVITGGLAPDHSTIARFVADDEQALADVFVEGVRLCALAGLVDLEVPAPGRHEDRGRARRSTATAASSGSAASSRG
jgi:hypothetical protein